MFLFNQFKFFDGWKLAWQWICNKQWSNDAGFPVLGKEQVEFTEGLHARLNHSWFFV